MFGGLDRGSRCHAGAAGTDIRLLELSKRVHPQLGLPQRKSPHCSPEFGAECWDDGGPSNLPIRRIHDAEHWNSIAFQLEIFLVKFDPTKPLGGGFLRALVSRKLLITMANVSFKAWLL